MTTLELGHEQHGTHADRQLVAGRYRLHAQIGRGRLGDIYEAHDEGYRELGVGNRVAIQLLPDRIALDHGLFSKLKLGYTVLRAGSHPNLVSYFDCDHDGKYGYLVMERLDGASLRFVLDDVTTLPLDEALPVIRAVGDALQFLHAKSMVHGQLTAENVFITENLEVRLLDVVPLDSASTILRGVASRDPFSRSDAGDDIYALACLTYEILAGKHPFNFHPPAEASLARLKPARIRSLSDKEWSALQKALSFDADKRPATVREFLDDFGVTGTERLRPSGADSARHPGAQPLPQHDDPRAKRPPDPAENAESPSRDTPPVMAAAAPRDEGRRKQAHARRRRASRVRSVILLLLLAGISAWFFYGQPGDDIADFEAFVESYGTNGDGDAASAPVTTAEPAAIEATAVTPAPEPPPQPVAGNEASPVAEPQQQGAVEAEPANAQEKEIGTTEASTADDTADAVPGDTLVKSYVTVYERDGAARIAFRQPLGTSGPLFWWTGDDTAIADADYIPIEQPVIAFASGEEAETIHVPLVNDSLPEPRETFYVYLGQRLPQSGRLEPIAQIRVDINDDD